MAHTLQTIGNDKKLRKALDLIKEHMTPEVNAQNRDLHQAISLIVGVARDYDLLSQEWGVRMICDSIAGGAIYACDRCAHDIEHDVITDDEGRLILTGDTGNFYEFCSLCSYGEPATHVVSHEPQEVR